MIVMKDDPNERNASMVKCVHEGRKNTKRIYQKNFEDWSALEDKVLLWLENVINWLENTYVNTDSAR